MTTLERNAPHLLIPAGGSGTRLWPLSRSRRPKFLVDLGTGESLIMGAARRGLRIAHPDRIHVITGTQHLDETLELTRAVGVTSYFAEPSPRDTGPAIAVGTMLVAAMDPDAIVICTPADHVILGDEEWDETITSAVAAASDGHLVAIGIPPRDPDTTLGYIHALQGNGERCRPVAAFREKPNADDAQMYFQSHDWFWNAGILIWRAESFIEALERHAPVLAGAAALAVREFGATGTVASDTWERLPRISIDYALCEAAAREGRMRVVPATFEWWDLGTWPSVAAFAKSQRRLPVGESDTVARLHSRGCFVHEDPGSTRRIALLGVSNLVVVDVGDVTLIADASSAQNVKELVGHLEALGWEDLI